MTTPIFFLFIWYPFVLAKRLMKKIYTLHNNFFEKMTNFTSKNFILFLTYIFFSIDLVTMEGLF
jgi:hypothetical protein